MAMSGFDDNNTIGRDVDAVSADLENAGLKCRGKLMMKDRISGREYGYRACDSKEFGLVCPQSYGVTLEFYLSNNKVYYMKKGKGGTNCF